MSVDALMENEMENTPQEESDAGYMARMRAAKEKQLSVHQNNPHPTMDREDAERKVASDAFRKQTMEGQGMSPAAINEAFARQGSVPPPGQAGHPAFNAPEIAAPAGVSTKFSVLKATAQIGEHDIKQAVSQFAPDWKALKDKIKDYNGTWLVTKFEFQPDVSLILGFFEKPGWDKPKDAEKESFEVIVQGGRVFRTDPE